MIRAQSTMHLDVSTPDDTSAILGVFGPQAGHPLNLLTSSSMPIQPYFLLNPQQHVLWSRQTCTLQTLGRNHSVTFLVLSLLHKVLVINDTFSEDTSSSHARLSLRAQFHLTAFLTAYLSQCSCVYTTLIAHHGQGLCPILAYMS